MTPTDADIARVVRDFRVAIDAAGPEPWARGGWTFPRGACGHAAELLGRYLIERLGITCDHVNQTTEVDIGGWTGAHSWLEWNGLFIDISGDQFGWAPVIVTRYPIHHGRGGEPTRQPVYGAHERDWWASQCGYLWRAISAHLPC